MCIKKIFKKWFEKKESCVSSPVTNQNTSSSTTPGVPGKQSATDVSIPTPVQTPKMPKRQFEYNGDRYFIEKAYYKNGELRVMYRQNDCSYEESYEYFHHVCDLFEDVDATQFYESYKN